VVAIPYVGTKLSSKLRRLHHVRNADLAVARSCRTRSLSPRVQLMVRRPSAPRLRAKVDALVRTRVKAATRSEFTNQFQPRSAVLQIVFLATASSSP